MIELTCSAAFLLFGVVKSCRHFICSGVLVWGVHRAQLDAVRHDALFKLAFLRDAFSASLSAVVLAIAWWILCFLSKLVHFESHLVESLLHIMTRLSRHLHIEHLVPLSKELRLLRGHATLHNEVWSSALWQTRNLLYQVKFEAD